MGARIAPGLALLLCCPVLGSAFALVSPAGAAGGGVSGVQSLGSPESSELCMRVPSASGCLHPGFQTF